MPNEFNIGDTAYIIKSDNFGNYHPAKVVVEGVRRVTDLSYIYYVTSSTFSTHVGDCQIWKTLEELEQDFISLIYA